MRYGESTGQQAATVMGLVLSVTSMAMLAGRRDHLVGISAKNLKNSLPMYLHSYKVHKVSF